MAAKDPLIGQRLGGFEIAELIGRGGMGAVYRASGAEGEVALKLLALDSLDDVREIERFQREAQLAGRLDHPNVVTVRGTGRGEGYLWMAMELVEGRSLRALLRQRGKFPLEQALSVAAQVLAALEAAHAQRIIHRDIKAENVILREDGVAKVLDFGVAKLEGGTVLTRANEILGTVEYMAPEQILGDGVGPATDLYAAGVLLYEMLTGALPFTGDSPATLVYHQLNEDPQAPSFLNPTVPRSLDRLVLRLLDKVPENRYPSATACLEALEEIRRRQQMLTIPGLDLGKREVDEEEELRTRHFRPRFVGRRGEVEQLHTTFDDLDMGGALLFLAGEAGAGKTRVVEELRHHVEERGGLLVQGTCFFEHGMGPYMPVLDALGELLGSDGLPQDERGELLELLEREAPELAPLAVDPTTTARLRAGFGTSFGSESDPEAARQRLFDTLFEVFSVAARQRHLVVVLEDMHWADEGTQQLLLYLARRAQEAPLLFLCTYRPEDLGAEGEEKAPLNTALKQLAAEDRLRELRLERLGREDVGRLARSLFLDAEFGAEFVDFLYEQSQGNPFYAVEILKLLRQQEVLYCESGIWSARPSFSDALVPERVNALIMRRIDPLDTEQRELLELAAVFGPSFTSRQLEKSLGMGRIPLLKALFRLEKQHRLLESKDGTFRFSHSKIREVLYGEIPWELRVEYHRIVAAVLEEQVGDGQEVNEAELGGHFFHAEEFAKALPLLLKAADQAYRLFGWRQAMRLYDQAGEACRRLGGRPEEQLHALKYGGRACEQLGAFDQALEKFAQMRQLAIKLGRPEDEGDSWVQTGRQHEKLRRFAEAERAYQQALEGLPEGQGMSVRADALVNLGAVAFEQGAYGRAEELWRESLEYLGEDQADALNNLAVLATVRGDLDAAWKLHQQVLELDGDGVSPQKVLTYYNMGMLRADQGQWDEALELYERSLEACEQTRQFIHEPAVQLNRGEALIGKGDLVGGREACSRALRGFRRLDDALGMADALRLCGRLCRLERNWDEGRAYLDKSVELNRQFGETVSLGEALFELGLLRRDAGDAEAARPPLEEAEQIFARIEAEPDLDRVRAALEELAA